MGTENYPLGVAGIREMIKRELLGQTIFSLYTRRLRQVFFDKHNSGHISTVEAFNIWNSLRARYASIQTHKTDMNFVHDRDLYMLLRNHLSHFGKQVNVLEKAAKDYKVKPPARPPEEINFTTKIDEITDDYIFKRIYADLHAELFALSRATRSSTTNDNLRKIFNDIFLVHINIFERYYKYGKLKGWTDIEPSYTSFKEVEREQLSVSEAYHIWDHLNERYDQIQLTQFYLTFAHDADFKKILSRGLTELTKQASILEKLATKFYVPLPKKPPAFQEASVDPEIMEDNFVFRRLFTGIQAAIGLHIRAVVETVRNDYLREEFYKLLKKELEILDAYLKYGKLKGWLPAVPTYSP
ncbi:MAG: DUF3231 family protein [Firmicutes bacterium]|nr:DUF3231 family protein [Bacillota bacterium]